MACLLDVTVPKPGNVHRGADFEDATFFDFAASAVAIGPSMQRASTLSPPSVGRTVFDAIQATREVTNTNTNLGIVLLLAPIAAVSDVIRENGSAWSEASVSGDSQSTTIADPVSDLLAPVLAAMTPEDARLTYEAIALAHPGGMDSVEEMDVKDEPPEDLLLAMSLAEDRDLVAKQYVTAFAEVCRLRMELLERVENTRGRDLKKQEAIRDAVVLTFVNLMHRHPDSLIARKCGSEIAIESGRRAGAVLEAQERGATDFHRALSDLDFWLRCDGNRRNPGTSADLITAAMFLALVENRLEFR